MNRNIIKTNRLFSQQFCVDSIYPSLVNILFYRDRCCCGFDTYILTINNLFCTYVVMTFTGSTNKMYKNKNVTLFVIDTPVVNKNEFSAVPREKKTCGPFFFFFWTLKSWRSAPTKQNALCTRNLT